MFDFLPGPYQSLVRTVITVLGTVATGLGVLSAVDMASVMSALQDISDGTKLIMRGGGAIMLIVGPTAGMLAARLRSKVADVKAAAPAELAQAMTQVSPKEMVIAVKDMPVVAGIVTTKDAAGRDFAASIPSPAVAAAGTSDAKVIAATGATP